MCVCMSEEERCKGKGQLDHTFLRDGATNTLQFRHWTTLLYRSSLHDT